MLKVNHPVRKAFAACSSGKHGAGYFETKGHAVDAFDAALRAHDLAFDCSNVCELNGDEGHAYLTVCDATGLPTGNALLTWYRMPSGRYEFTGYLS